MIPRAAILGFGALAAAGAFLLAEDWATERYNARHVNPELRAAFKRVEAYCLFGEESHIDPRCDNVLRRLIDCEKNPGQRSCSPAELRATLANLGFEMPAYHDPNHAQRISYLDQALSLAGMR